MTAPAPPSRSWLNRINPVWLVVASITSVQVGAAVAKNLFGVVTPSGMTWLRVITSSVVFALVARPQLRGRTVREWGTALGLGLCLATMNWAIYQSFSRIPLGLAVTLEFLGPLTVAVVGSRRPRDLLWVVLAGAGVALLGFSPGRLDWVGIGLALLAGTAWAGYILLTAATARSWPGITGLTVASWVAAFLLAIPAFASATPGMWQPWVIGVGFAVGLLSSVVPYSLEMSALRRIKPGVFGILMSLEPAAAALAALVVIGEQLVPLEWVAMACVIAASVGATRTRPEALEGEATTP